MKKIIFIIILLFLAQYSLACSIENIYTEEQFRGNYEISIETKACVNENINVFARDLMTLTDKNIYYGEINSDEMVFYWENYIPGIKKIYIQIEEENYFTILEEPVPTDEITARHESPWMNPRTIEYAEIRIDIRAGFLDAPVNLENQKFGFYFENQDFNILWENPAYLKESYQLESHPNRSHYYLINLNDVKRFKKMDVNITSLKYNDRLVIFAGTQDKNAYQIIDINAMPFTTINEIEFDYDLNNLSVTFDVYNAHDVNYCSLLLEGNSVQTISDLKEKNNYFEQIISPKNYLVDINCVTDGNHYLVSTRSGNVSDTKYPEIDNVPFLSDNPKEINIKWPFVKNDLNYLEVKTCEQLNYVQNYPNSNFVLKNNLDCSGVTINPIINFNGVFDGNKNVIHNLEIVSENNNIGLFSHLFGTIKNLGIEDANIIGNQNVGILAGTNNGNIYNVYTTGQIIATKNAGGIAGTNNGQFNSRPYSGYYFSDAPLAKIVNSYSIININANNSGGIAGTNKGIIENVYSAGQINGTGNGALVSKSQIICYHYQHYTDSSKIINSFSNIDLNIDYLNHCYSIWYYGNAVTHFAIKENSLINTNENYLSNINNSPFTSWDFNNIWKLGENFRTNYIDLNKATHMPVLFWEQ